MTINVNETEARVLSTALQEYSRVLRACAPSPMDDGAIIPPVGPGTALLIVMDTATELYCTINDLIKENGEQPRKNRFRETA